VAVSLALACGGGGANNDPAQSTGASAGGEAQTYTVRLHRPSRVGQRLRVRTEATSSESRVTRMGGTQGDRTMTRRRTTIDCVAEILAVNRAGKATRLALTVASLQSESDQQTVASLGSDSRLELSLGAREDQTTITLGGQPVSREVRAAIKDVHSLSVDELTDDETFGTPQPRAVGASWPARVETLRTALEGTGMNIAADGIRATVTLADVNQREPGAPMMELRGEVTIERMSLAQLPPGFTSSTMNMRMRMEKVVSATNLEAPPVSEMSAMTSHAELSGTVNGQPVTIEMEMENERRTTFSPTP